MVYFVTFIFALILIAPASAHRSFNRLSGLILVTILCVLASIRVDTGTDFPTYVDIWEATPSFGEVTIAELIGGFYEPIFANVNVLLRTFSSSQFLFFAFYACLTLIILHFALRRVQSINLPYAYIYYLSVFFLPYTLNGMRQAIAMSIFLLSIPAFLERRTRTVLLMTLLAAGFHFSGFLVGLGYLFLRICQRLQLKVWSVFLLATAVGGLMAGTGLLGQFFFLIFPGAINVYADLFDAASSLSNVVMRVGLGVLMLASTDLGKGDRRHIDSLLTVYCLGLLIFLALFQFNVLATRFNMLFRILEVVLLPLIAARLSRGWRLAFGATTLALALATLVVTAEVPDYYYSFSLPF